MQPSGWVTCWRGVGWCDPSCKIGGLKSSQLILPRSCNCSSEMTGRRLVPIYPQLASAWTLLFSKHLKSIFTTGSCWCNLLRGAGVSKPHQLCGTAAGGWSLHLRVGLLLYMWWGDEGAPSCGFWKGTRTPGWHADKKDGTQQGAQAPLKASPLGIKTRKHGCFDRTTSFSNSFSFRWRAFQLLLIDLPLWRNFEDLSSRLFPLDVPSYDHQNWSEVGMLTTNWLSIIVN